MGVEKEEVLPTGHNGLLSGHEAIKETFRLSRVVVQLAGSSSKMRCGRQNWQQLYCGRAPVARGKPQP
ncbi:hypothetical protein GN956_G9380 [Arapaima gigas]